MSTLCLISGQGCRSRVGSCRVVTCFVTTAADVLGVEFHFGTSNEFPWGGIVKR